MDTMTPREVNLETARDEAYATLARKAQALLTALEETDWPLRQEVCAQADACRAALFQVARVALILSQR